MELKLIKREDLAALLSMPPHMVKALTAARKIPCVRLGHRTVRYDVAKVKAALEKFEVNAVENPADAPSEH